jgi:hypothetical protein
MKFRNDHCWGRINEETVAAFEARNGIALPGDYRAFLLAHHGGVPDPNFYWVVPGDWGSEIESLYGFGKDGFMLQEYLDTRESTGLPSDMLAIGDDGCCNFLAVGIAGKRRGQVFYIDHEIAPGEPGHERLLASSFPEFLERLCVAPGY